MRQSREQRYRQGYDAAASCDLMLTPLHITNLLCHRRRYSHEDVR